MMPTTPDTNVSKPSKAQVNAFRSDMFGRTKVSSAFTLFDSVHNYQDNGYYSDQLANNATVTFNADESTAYLNVTTENGSEVSRESNRVFPYQAGKSIQAMSTFGFASPQTGLRQRVGHFTRSKGFFLELDDNILYLVKRSNSTGAPVDIRVPQSQWNVDRLDGTGPSDVALDLAAIQILFIELEWFGIGAARIGFVIDGYFVIAHQFNHSNYLETSYMSGGPMPLRFELTNKQTTATVSSFKQIASSVILNGGTLTGTDIWTASRGATEVGTEYYPLVAVRMKEGRSDGAVVIPELLSIFPLTDNDFEWALILNPSSVTGGTWETSEEKGNVEYNVTATATAGGRKLLEGFFGANNQTSVPINYGDITNLNLQFGRSNAVPPVSDVMVLAAKATSYSEGTLKSAFTWYDLT